MTPPLTRHPPGPLMAIALGAVIVGIALPWARRDDWLGWFAFAIVALGAGGLWAMLLWGIARSTVEWWRTRSDQK